MKHQGLTGFVLLVGVALLEALQERPWMAAAMVCVGLFFIAMDRPRVPHRSTVRQTRAR